jgi:protein-S-isoprenylcysteine O-methyltransferase Ste14
MNTLKTAIVIVWIIFWVYWFASAVGVREGRASRRRIPLNGLSALSVLLVLRVFRGGSLAVRSPVLEAIGAVVFASGIALAIWARVHLGQNWGMPMTRKAEPELVTSGPYRFMRHPIYSGLLLALLGTALVVNLIGLILVAVLVLLLLRIRGGEESPRNVPHGVSGVPSEHEDADSLPALGAQAQAAMPVRARKSSRKRAGSSPKKSAATTPSVRVAWLCNGHPLGR